ncbi:unnamed protein product [Arctogadus glacialis]
MEAHQREATEKPRYEGKYRDTDEDEPQESQKWKTVKEWESQRVGGCLLQEGPDLEGRFRACTDVTDEPRDLLIESSPRTCSPLWDAPPSSSSRKLPGWIGDGLLCGSICKPLDGLVGCVVIRRSSF